MIEIKFISTHPGVIDTPIEPISQHLPDWYKEMKRDFAPPTAQNLMALKGETTSTIKGCIPVQDYLTSGYLIRCPDKVIMSSIMVQSNPQANKVRGTTFFCPNENILKFHNHFQCPIDIEGEKKGYIKFNPGWIIQTPPGYSCYFYQPEFFMEQRFKLFPAIVDTDQYTFNPIMFPGYASKNFEDITVEVGTPLMAVFPFKRTNWTSSVSENLNFMNEEKNMTLLRRFNRLVFQKYAQYCHQVKRYR